MSRPECEMSLMFVKGGDERVEAGPVPPRPAPRKAPRQESLRRVPTQDRGRARVEAILDAAEIAFAEVGYDNATTEAIAQRAGASIGSLYQFFPNKRALFEAVSARYLGRVRALFEGTLSGVLPDMPWQEVLDLSIDAFWGMARSSPAFSAIWLQGRVTKELLDAGYALNRLFADRADEVLQRYAPTLPRKRRALLATMIVETTSGMLFSAVRAVPPTASDEIIGETKRMLRAYVRDVLATESR